MKRTKLILSMLAIFGAPAAFAQEQGQDATNPFYVGVSGGVTHVSNVYRTGEGSSGPSGSSNSDMVYTGSLLAGIDQRYGRQHLTADGSINGNRYQHNSDLNNIGYNGRVGLDWHTIQNISGNFSLGGSRQLGSNNVGYGYAPQYVKNVQTDFYASAVAHKGLVTEWTLDVGADYQRRSFSATYYRRLDSRQHDVWIGPSWRPSDKLRLGMDYRLSKGELPYYSQDVVLGTVESNRFTRKDIDFTGAWVLSGASSFEWRISRGKSTHNTTVGQDFSGTTGQLSWNWRPSGRFSLQTQYVHDTGLSTSFLSFFGTSYNNYAQDQVTNSWRLYGNYQYSGKLSFGANLSYSPASLRVTPTGAPSSTDYNFRDYNANLSASWQYSRGITFACQAGRQWRTGAAELYPYTANSIGCTGRILFF